MNKQKQKPKKESYNSKQVEEKIRKFWDKEKIYKFNSKSGKKVYSIDTPPPTVSGKMHIGHAFSYSQQDFIARYRKMKGENIFYPFGTDDNGLATDRLIEKLKKVRSKEMKRDKYIDLALKTLKEILPDFIEDWKKIGMSCDFNIYYSTIDDDSRKIAQQSFLDLYKIKRVYRKQAATVYCPECHTAIAQVELKDKEIDSHFNDVVFETQDGEEMIIATTRPELLPSCVAVFYHPDDERYKHLKGKKAKVPIFDYFVPILEDRRVDMEKGTGIVMCCTYGDLTDIEWQKAYDLPIKISINQDGTLNEVASPYNGMKIKQAREKIIEDLKHKNLLKQQKKITHAVNVHERCGTEVEFLQTKQWFVKYLDLKQKFLEQGNKINWFPKHMKHRYDNWIKGLQWNWCISRQRYFGIPFPIWYCSKCNEVILADEKQLPIDPIYDKPKSGCAKCKNKNLIPEEDVLDTWFTSSMTPQLAIDRARKKGHKEKLFPMQLRPQAHDIITFWAFNTVVKSYFHEKKIPWENIIISGFVTRGKEKMSKSKGNIIQPQEILEKYGADAMRYWAAGSKLGEDLDYQEKDILTGKRFITKLFNSSRFVFMNLKDYKKQKPKKMEIIDKWFLSKLNETIKILTENFEKYEYSKAKAEIENFFWKTFCDNYLEIIKNRIYNEKGDKKLSAQYTLYTSLFSILKLVSPFMPFITEEVYQNHFKKHEKQKSIHHTNWPDYDKKSKSDNVEKTGDLFINLLSKVRQEKTKNKKSVKAEIKLTLEKKHLDMLGDCLEDFKAVTNCKKISEGKFGVEFL